MGKLIYVDRLKKDILALQDCYNGFSDTYDKACIIGVIEEQPTIEERKTGEWRFPYTDKRYKKCSVCGREFYSIPRTSHYCPNCGADMRGDNDA